MLLYLSMIIPGAFSGLLDQQLELKAELTWDDSQTQQEFIGARKIERGRDSVAAEIKSLRRCTKMYYMYHY